MTSEERIGVLHRWWRFHVDAVELDATWQARWGAFLSAGYGGPDLSAAAMLIRADVQSDLPHGSLREYGEPFSLEAVMVVDQLWDATTHLPTAYLVEMIGFARERAQSAAARPVPRPPRPPRKPRAKAPEAVQEAKAPAPVVATVVAPVAPPVAPVKQFSFGDLRKEFGL